MLNVQIILKKIIILVLLFDILSVSISYGMIDLNSEDSISFQESSKLIEDFFVKEITKKSIEKLVEVHVPFKFREKLLESVNGDIDLLMDIISIGYIESDWVHMKSFKANKNKSIDLGPLGLNSYNINNEDFMKKFNPEIIPEDKDIHYMLVSINYFKYLMRMFGYYASFLSYNGGMGRLMDNRVPKSTYRYRDKVLDMRRNVHISYNGLYKEIKKDINKVVFSYISIETDNYLYRNSLFFSKDENINNNRLDNNLIVRKEDLDYYSHIIDYLEEVYELRTRRRKGRWI